MQGSNRTLAALVEELAWMLKCYPEGGGGEPSAVIDVAILRRWQRVIGAAAAAAPAQNSTPDASVAGDVLLEVTRLEVIGEAGRLLTLRPVTVESVQCQDNDRTLKIFVKGDAAPASPPETSDLHLRSFDIVQTWLSECQKPGCHPCFECSAKLHAIVKGLLANGHASMEQQR